MPFMYLISVSLKLHSNCKIVGTHSFRHKSTNISVIFFTYCLWFDAISLHMNRSLKLILFEFSPYTINTSVNKLLLIIIKPYQSWTSVNWPWTGFPWPPQYWMLPREASMTDPCWKQRDPWISISLMPLGSSLELERKKEFGVTDTFYA